MVLLLLNQVGSWHYWHFIYKNQYQLLYKQSQNKRVWFIKHNLTPSLFMLKHKITANQLFQHQQPTWFFLFLSKLTCRLIHELRLQHHVDPQTQQKRIRADSSPPTHSSGGHISWTHSRFHVYSPTSPNCRRRPCTRGPIPYSATF